MTHAQRGQGNKLKEHAKENKKAKTGNYDSGGKISRRVNISFHP